MRISDWSSDVALPISAAQPHAAQELRRVRRVLGGVRRARSGGQPAPCRALVRSVARGPDRAARHRDLCAGARSEEHTSELQSLMRISYAVFCLKKKKKLKT